MKKFWKYLRGFLVVLATVILSTVALNATDNAGNFSDSLLGLAIGLEEEGCPEGMVLIPSDEGGFCIDTYEASASDGCQYGFPENQLETRLNLEKASCKAVSVGGAMPWTNIARHQAELACAKAGKRLPSNAEWYRASLGTPDSKVNVLRGDCNIGNNGIVALTTSRNLCKSSIGTFDMIGNVWEWVDETVSDGKYKGRDLPVDGYVLGIDSDGLPIETSTSTIDLNYNEDYFHIEKEGVRGMVRGGYWGSGSDAGLYAVNAITPPSFTGAAVGFRCAK